MVVDYLTAFFKVVQLFKNCDGDDNVMLLEVVDAGAVVQDNVGIEDKGFFLRGHKGPG